MLAGSGCGANGGPGTTRPARLVRTEQQHAKRQAVRRHRRAIRRHQARALARHRAARRARQVALRERRAEERARAAEAAAEETVATETEEASDCDPNYSGACLDPHAYDYDCAGGSGDGPDYTGTVTVVGEDHYGLDADGDGIGCEDG
jgi:hypothetical protein